MPRKYIKPQKSRREKTLKYLEEESKSASDNSYGLIQRLDKTTARVNIDGPFYVLNRLHILYWTIMILKYLQIEIANVDEIIDMVEGSKNEYGVYYFKSSSGERQRRPQTFRNNICAMKVVQSLGYKPEKNQNLINLIKNYKTTEDLKSIFEHFSLNMVTYIDLYYFIGVVACTLATNEIEKKVLIFHMNQYKKKDGWYESKFIARTRTSNLFFEGIPQKDTYIAAKLLKMFGFEKEAQATANVWRTKYHKGIVNKKCVNSRLVKMYIDIIKEFTYESAIVNKASKLIKQYWDKENFDLTGYMLAATQDQYEALKMLHIIGGQKLINEIIT